MGLIAYAGDVENHFTWLRHAVDGAAFLLTGVGRGHRDACIVVVDEDLCLCGRCLQCAAPCRIAQRDLQGLLVFVNGFTFDGEREVDRRLPLREGEPRCHGRAIKVVSSDANTTGRIGHHTLATQRTRARHGKDRWRAACVAFIELANLAAGQRNGKLVVITLDDGGGQRQRIRLQRTLVGVGQGDDHALVCLQVAIPIDG